MQPAWAIWTYVAGQIQPSQLGPSGRMSRTKQRSSYDKDKYASGWRTSLTIRTNMHLDVGRRKNTASSGHLDVCRGTNTASLGDLNVCRGPNTWYFSAPRLIYRIYVSPSCVCWAHSWLFGRCTNTASLGHLDVCCGPKRWHFSAPSPVYRFYVSPGRMLRAKKVTFLGTAPGLRLSYVSPS